jgi:hypothetical protein
MNHGAVCVMLARLSKWKPRALAALGVRSVCMLFYTRKAQRNGTR